MLQSISRDTSWIDDIVSKSTVKSFGPPIPLKAADSKNAKPRNPLASRLAHVSSGQAYHSANVGAEHNDVESSASDSEDDSNVKPTGISPLTFSLPPGITKEHVETAYMAVQRYREQGVSEDDRKFVMFRNLLQAVQQQQANASRAMNEAHGGAIIAGRSTGGPMDATSSALPPQHRGPIIEDYLNQPTVPKVADPSAESMQQRIRVARREAEALKLRIKQKKNELAARSTSETGSSHSAEDLGLNLKRDCGTIHYTISRSADWTDNLLHNGRDVSDTAASTNESGSDVSDSASLESESGEGSDDIPEAMRDYLALQAKESGKSFRRELLRRGGRMTERVMQKGM